jgi:hypothetical protein
MHNKTSATESKKATPPRLATRHPERGSQARAKVKIEANRAEAEAIRILDDEVLRAWLN